MTHINTASIVDDGVALVSLQRGRDRKFVILISVHDVDKLLLFYRRDHEGPSDRIYSEILSRDDSSNSCFAVSFLMYGLKLLLDGIELQNDDSSRICPKKDVVSIGSVQSEGTHSSDDAEHIHTSNLD